MDDIYDKKGDNARKSWEWHNTEVGKGYQASGVIRQPGVSTNENKIRVVDFSKPKIDSTNKISHRNISSNSSSDSFIEEGDGRSSKKHKSEKRDKKKKKEKDKKSKKSKKSDRNDHDDDHDSNQVPFNPILQYFAARISESTRNF